MSASKKFLRMMNPMHSTSGHSVPQGIIPQIIFGFVWLFICLWLSNQAGVKMSSQINALEKERDMLKTRSKKIEVNMTSMLGGEMLTDIAIKRYNFKRTASGQVVVLPKKTGLFERLKKTFGNTLNNQNEL